MKAGDCVTVLLGALLSVFFLEFFHEFDQFFRAFNRHRVVNGRAHTTDRAMSLETDQVILLGFLGERIFQFFRGEAEGYVHV